MTWPVAVVVTLVWVLLHWWAWVSLHVVVAAAMVAVAVEAWAQLLAAALPQALEFVLSTGGLAIAHAAFYVAVRVHTARRRRTSSMGRSSHR